MRSAWPCLPSPTRRVESSVCHPGGPALLVGTGEPLGVDPNASSPAAFHLTPGAHRRRHRLHNRRVGAREATGWAIVGGAWLEQTAERATPGGFGLPLQGQDGESFGNTAVRERTGGHTRAGARTPEASEESSPLEMGRREASLEGRRKRVERTLKRVGEKAEFSTINMSHPEFLKG
jgi:hypothetical protein